MVRHEQQRLFAAGMAAIVGVDAGKFAHALAVQRSDGTRAPPILVPTTRTGFEAGLVSLQQLISAPADRVLIAIEFAGYFGFTLAHFLHAHGYPIVSVLPAHTKRFKDVVHGQPLKSDPKDAETVAERMTELIRTARPKHMLLHFQAGASPQKIALRSIEQFAERVRPMIEKALGPLDKLGIEQAAG